MYDLYVVCIISWNPEVVNLYNCCFKTDRVQIEIEIHFVRTRPDNTDSLRKFANKLKTERSHRQFFSFLQLEFSSKNLLSEKVWLMFLAVATTFSQFFFQHQRNTLNFF